MNRALKDDIKTSNIFFIDLPLFTDCGGTVKQSLSV